MLISESDITKAVEETISRAEKRGSVLVYFSPHYRKISISPKWAMNRKIKDFILSHPFLIAGHCKKEEGLQSVESAIREMAERINSDEEHLEMLMDERKKTWSRMGPSRPKRKLPARWKDLNFPLTVRLSGNA
ncbi:hypothetical protein [Nitrosococcus wardiae]|uniref:Uncharacterized protein n=1 Tax=Nitrosococcus wardiae TaxID=1814290 RepID=A0A4P7C063_9GAMM|nr:hypothetical protein [Nitrosococcus wardiae]QBQ54949.1 hypothetical protein E3U44_10790 [Nitrosococcus wardiae]